jgi:hypothetical protein
MQGEERLASASPVKWPWPSEFSIANFVRDSVLKLIAVRGLVVRISSSRRGADHLARMWQGHGESGRVRKRERCALAQEDGGCLAPEFHTAIGLKGQLLSRIRR